MPATEMPATKMIPATTIPVPAGRQLLKVGEAKQRLALGKSKFYQLLQSGRLRSVKIDGARRIEESALNEFIAGLTGTAE